MEPCIMVVDDSRDIRELLCDLLSDEGYAVAIYGSPLTAMADLDRLRPDLIILDWLFAGEPAGLEMLQSLRMRSASSALPVVVCSAAAGHLQELEAFLDRQGAAVVSKPFLVDDLLATVDSALHHARGVLRPFVNVPSGVLS